KLAFLVGPEHTDRAAVFRPFLKNADTAHPAAYALCNIDGSAGEEALPVIRRHLTDGHPPPHRARAVAAAPALDQPRLLDAVALRRDLGNSSLPLRRTAALALGRLKAKEAVSELAAFIAKPNADAALRRESAFALAAIGGSSSSAAMIKRVAP